MYYIIILYHIYIPHVQTNRCPELANDTHATHLRLPHLRKHLIFHGQKLGEIEGSPPITQNVLKQCVYIICVYIYKYKHILHKYVNTYYIYIKYSTVYHYVMAVTYPMYLFYKMGPP